MLFSSYIFIFMFLPFVWLGFHFLKSLSFRHSYTLAKLFLVLSSLFFYAYFKLEYLPILLGSIVINYYFALAILRSSHTLTYTPTCNLSRDSLLSTFGGGGKHKRYEILAFHCKSVTLGYHERGSNPSYLCLAILQSLNLRL